MAKKRQAKGIDMIGKIPALKMTQYYRDGEIVTRKSYSKSRSGNSRNQFIQQQRQRHSVALWKEMPFLEPRFIQLKMKYPRFISLANKLTVVYLPKSRVEVEGSLLIPGIPVSDGPLPTIGQQLGELPLLSPSDSSPRAGEQQGTPALITDFKTANLRPYEVYALFTAEQQVGRRDVPKVAFSVREVRQEEFVTVDGCVALVGEEFANEMRGWALVRLGTKGCSSQGIVTRCSYYEHYTTEEALQKAAKSYGGLK